MERHIMNVLVLTAASWLRRPGRAAGTAAVALSLAAAVMTAGPPGASAAAGPSAPPARQPAAGMRAACAPSRPGFARCYTLWGPQASVNRAIAAGVTGAAATPKGWGARDLESAYKLPVSRHPHQTVAVTIAYNTPHLAHYLAVYRKEYGLPACTSAGGCFRVVNQNGRTSPLPSSGKGSGWDLEITLDISMISAACPHCHILVVEANQPSLVALGKAEDTAARLGAQVISNSYGTREDGYSFSLSKYYNHPGHTIVVSAGDFGYTAASWPANLRSVTSVGGTELHRAANARRWSETTWNNDWGAGGSGCSAYVPKPSWQPATDCPMRTVADVSAAAFNIPVYNTVYGGWVTVAGTSASAPLIAGIYGLAGNGATTTQKFLYAHASSLFDITSGNNDWFSGSKGAACGFDSLCVAGPGYDAPTGLGTPRGTGAF
jgi:subtilase family serine protease